VNGPPIFRLQLETVSARRDAAGPPRTQPRGEGPKLSLPGTAPLFPPSAEMSSSLFSLAGTLLCNDEASPHGPPDPAVTGLEIPPPLLDVRKGPCFFHRGAMTSRCPSQLVDSPYWCSRRDLLFCSRPHSRSPAKPHLAPAIVDHTAQARGCLSALRHVRAGESPAPGDGCRVPGPRPRNGH